MNAIFYQPPSDWQRVRDENYEAAWREFWPDDVEPPASYQHRDGLTALVGREPYADGTTRWHISVRYGDPGINGRVPTWEELVQTAHELRPGVVFVLALPPRSWWMNVHPDVLHLIEPRDPALIQSLRANALADEPT